MQSSDQVTLCAVWVQCQNMISVSAGLLRFGGIFASSDRRDLGAGLVGGWPRSLSPAWRLAALDGASLAQAGPFCTGFSPFPDFHLRETRARIFFFAVPAFSFSPPDAVRQHP